MKDIATEYYSSVAIATGTVQNTKITHNEIINTSCSFIQKNKYQLRKNLNAQFSLKNPIKIIYYDNNN